MVKTPKQAAADKPRKRIAVLSEDGRLIGAREVDSDSPEAVGIDPGDLKLDGSYKFDDARGAFMPLGHGFGKVYAKQPHSIEMVIVRLLEKLESSGIEIPIEAVEFRTWYNENIRQRDEELRAVGKLR